MSDAASRDDQAAIEQLAVAAMRQLAAGSSAEDVSRELQSTGLAKSTADGLVEHAQQTWTELAAAPQANYALYFSTKYPEMRPVRSRPTLLTVHGIGAGLYNRRDHDPATGTFVKTHCLSILFVPVLALGAYRIAVTSGGWSLIGKVPLSRFARWWNVLFPLGIAALIGLAVMDAAENSPSAVAGRKLAQADKAAAEGNLLEAARLYSRVAAGRTEHAGAAQLRCVQLIDRPEIDSMALRDVTTIFGEVTSTVRLSGQWPAVMKRGISIVKRSAKTDPKGSIALLQCLSSLSPEEAYQEFAELAKGPLSALPPDEAVAVFSEAAQIPRSEPDKAAFADLATKQFERVAKSNVPAALELLAALAPLGTPATIDKCLNGLFAGPLDQAPCSAVQTAVESAKKIVGPSGEKKLFALAMAWGQRHPQADSKEMFALLEQLSRLDGADEASIAAVRRPLLEKLVAANPQDVELTVQLALAVEAEGSKTGAGHGAAGDPAVRIVVLLAPLRDKLGAGEGARALGQALAAQGKYDESYALLSPYLDQRLDAFHQAEQAYATALEQAESRIVQQLRDGTAPGFDFRRASLAGENEGRAMAVEYMARQVKEDAEVNAARETLARQAMVVPAALDLGMVTLEHAQGMKDAAARRKELERAEKTFLAIRGTAGEADEYMLRLGQVYYWLGKQKEGQQEFDKLLAKHDRKPDLLCSIASVLRDLGAATEARKMLEEAYDKASDDRLRHTIAQVRAITYKDLDDEIHWLERCDQVEGEVKALLAKSQGARAEEQGKDDEAAAFYREAAAVYEKQAPTAAALNNGALAYLQLFELTGDRAALDRATQWVEKAVALMPSDSVVLSNAGSQLLRAAVQDLAGSQLNLRELQMSGSLPALCYLVSDQKGLDDLRRRAREHGGLRKALNYMERASVLAPKSRGNAYLVSQIYSFLRDREGLQRLAARLAASQMDMEEAERDSLKYFRYDEQPSAKEALIASIARRQSLVAKLQHEVKGPQYAAAVDNLIELKLTLPASAGVDADEMVRLAEDAHASGQSYASYGAEINVLMFRAGKKLAADFPEYARATRDTGRSASAYYAVALAMERNDAPRRGRPRE